MIPVNNAIVTALAAIAAVALITAWVCREYWRARADDAYQDGHSAGIQTQIAREQRARARPGPAARRAMDAYFERARPSAADDPPTDVRTVTVGVARYSVARHAPPAVIPFPEGLPPGLREYATQVLAAAAPPPPVQPDDPVSRIERLARDALATAPYRSAGIRGEDSIRRVIAFTAPDSGPAL